MFVRAVGRSFEHLIVPALVEKGLSDMHKSAGVRDECAEANNQSLSAMIEHTICTNPFVDSVQLL